MRIFKTIFKKLLYKPDSIISIGYFDSFHLGHQKLINELIRISNEKKLRHYVMTFDFLPNKEKNGKRILETSDKIKLFKDIGVQNLILCQFDSSISDIEPENFIKILKENFNINHYVSGYDFTFGKNQKGTIDDLKRLGCDSYIVDPVFINNKRISTTLIKSYILNGYIEHANSFIGREFYIKGQIIKGKQIGRKIGFPTMNIFNNNVIKPKNGVYITKTNIKNDFFYSLTYVDDGIIESFLLDYNKFSYNTKIKVDFFKKIRDNRVFKSKSLLIEQIKKDLDKLNDFVKDRSNK